MLAPKKIKYRKPQKGRMRGMANTGDYVAFGTFGLKAVEAGWITSRQIEAGRISIEESSTCYIILKNLCKTNNMRIVYIFLIFKF